MTCQSLLLKKIFKGLASIGWTAGSWLRKGGGDLCGLLIGRWRGIFFDGGAKFIELTVVLAVLGSNALGNRLGAFKLRAGIEEAALLAAMELGVALWTGAGGVESRDENRTAIGAACAGYGADHSGGAGPEMIVLASRSALRRFALRA